MIYLGKEWKLMNKEWSLNELYTGYDDIKFKEDIKKADEAVAKIKTFASKLEGEPKEVIKKGLCLMEEFETVFTNLILFANLKQSTNTTDAESSSVLGRLMAKVSSITAERTAFFKYIAAVDNLDSVIASDSLLTEYSYMLRRVKQDSRYLLDEKTEAAISLMTLSGSSAWGDLQQYLTSTVPVEFRGEKTNLADIRNKAYDPDQSVRKEAYEAELACYDRIKDAVAFSLNSIKLEVLNRCRLKGYESPLQQTLYNAHMKKETLDALIGAMEEYMPKFHEYLRAKAGLLGHKGALPWYDLFAPVGSDNKKYSTEEARDYLVGLFAGFDEDLANMVKRAFDEAWIDFFPRSGKVGGAFCCSIHTIKQSRVLTNYDGTIGDIVTLAHELGHAFHNYNIFDNRILNNDYTMPVAETASTFNEIVVLSAAIKAEKDANVKRALIEGQLMDATQIICDIYSRYLFETAVFENRDQDFMFPDRLCELMTEAQKMAYGDGLDHNVLHPYMWLCKSHYYSGGLSFYNFPYAFGGLFARGLYAKYEREGQAFVPLYKKLLNATATMDVEDAAMVAGIDLTDKEFWRLSLQSLAEEIDLFKELCK
jgi:pepF/M3 family oligoendopeptidase